MRTLKLVIFKINIMSAIENFIKHRQALEEELNQFIFLLYLLCDTIF